MLLLSLLAPAFAADVVWVGEPPEDQRAAVLAASGGATLPLIDLRAAPTDATPEDDAALDQLADAVKAVRAYETQLDGELVIMRDLQPAIDAVTLLRSDTERGALFSALAYQGFAVERYFGDDLETAEEAGPYRASLNGLVVEKPWLDAVALDPEREVSAYEIAEAPQRIAFAGTQAVVKEVLPGSIKPPSDAGQLFVDGRAVQAGATGDLKVPPGRHLVHLEKAGRVLGRWDVRLDPGQQMDLDLDLPDDVWTGFVDGLSADSAVPREVVPSIEAVGGEVWFASPGAKKPVVWSVTPDGVEAVDVAMTRAGDDDSGDGVKRPRVHLALLGGWTGSQDFYYQDPTGLEPVGSTVNAATVGASVGSDLHLGPLRLGAGIDAMLPLGPNHVANTGAGSMRLRPVPHVSVGVGPATVALGYVLPYHPAIGGRGALPLPGPFELRWMGWFGLPTTRERDGAEPYQFEPLGMAAGGLGIRI